MNKTFWAIDPYLAQIREVSAEARSRKEKAQQLYSYRSRTQFVPTKQEAVAAIVARITRKIQQIEKNLENERTRLRKFEKKYEDVL